MKTILVCEAQVPFVHGGAEILVRELVRELRARGHLAELVSIPFKRQPKEEILPHAAVWRLLDLSESNGRPIDVVIASKFPTYCVRHPRKVAWLVHQYREAYELCGTPYSDFYHTEQDVGLRDRLIRLDTEMLSECRGLYTIARTTAARLEKYNGLHAATLYHPPHIARRLKAGPYGDYVLSVGRIEAVKRVGLVVRSMAHVDRPLRLVVAGDGSWRDNVEKEAHAAGVADRVTFLGRVDDDRLIDLYAGALAIVFAPYEEDYGYVTLEAFLARKPVVTCVDSGGPTEFVVDGTNGLVCDAVPEALGQAINRLAADRRYAGALGDGGYEIASRITWDGVIERLLE